jgi:hypothetical protein
VSAMSAAIVHAEALVRGDDSVLPGITSSSCDGACTHAYYYARNAAVRRYCTPLHAFHALVLYQSSAGDITAMSR